MFGIIRPCHHRLGDTMGAAWQAHLCGVCLALRDDHGHLARLVTNYDGLVVSALVEAQSPAGPARRAAGRCALRGMRTAEVATGDCVRLAATVSLVLAAAKVCDHVDDRDGVLGRYGMRTAARHLAGRWSRQGAASGDRLGFDTAVLVDAVDRQSDVEAAAGLGSPLLVVTEPTETATAAAFGYTAPLAGRPGNQAALSEVGRLFGRVAHLLDAVEDLAEDTAAGVWNPLSATGTSVAEARELCADAVLGISLALAEVEFTDGRLVHRLLGHELHRALRRTFDHGGKRCGGHPTAGAPGYPPQPGEPVPQPPGGAPTPAGFPSPFPQPGPAGFPDPSQPNVLHGGEVGYPGPPSPRRCCGACDCCDCCECCECLECCDC